jgi:long-chain acyl-CoA synthetase
MIMKGYYKLADKSLEDLHNGWMMTGDVGCITPQGGIKIIDRVKSIFKLQHSGYIAPEKLEAIYSQSSFINQIMITGLSTKDYILAFVHSNPDAFANFIDDKEVIKEKVQQEIIRLVAEFKLRDVETPMQIHIMDEPFSIQNGCLTATLKLKRQFVSQQHFKKEIDEMYEMKPLDMMMNGPK